MNATITQHMQPAEIQENIPEIRLWLKHSLIGLALLFAAIWAAENVQSPVLTALLYLPFLCYLAWKGFGFRFRTACVISCILLAWEDVTHTYWPQSGWGDILNVGLCSFLVLKAAKS